MLIGLSASSMEEKERSDTGSMAELSALCETAGIEVLAEVIQSRQSPEPKTFVGLGKLLEVRELAQNLEADLLVFDNELSPSQAKNIEDMLKIRVLDRSGLILDIFSERAMSREGQLQVELAQYEYLLPRLSGMWAHLASQTASGGSSPVGTRGPGETQLETDRRTIRRRISALKKSISELRRVRSVSRATRLKNEIPQVALIGYTNSGKSTLMNSLTDAEVSANDRLFDTLDTKAKKLRLSATSEVILTDTVGFIRKLPTDLIEAFKATLEELTWADLLLHVVDISGPDRLRQIEVVEDMIKTLGISNKPRITVYNKCDRLCDIMPRDADTVCISALYGKGLEELKAKISEKLEEDSERIKVRIPYEKAGLIENLHSGSKLYSLDYADDGIVADVLIKNNKKGAFEEYVIR
ncbi:MAG: GTPase HflX [Clostridiales bacterium]|nr:GTPase HflX [Clostridiales bacterium]